MEKYFDISEELKKLPQSPGVYFMYNDAEEVIYIGKAVHLKNRVRQYFQKGKGKSVKIERMVSQIKRFEYIITDTEMEALILECNMIKEHHPRYNTMLTDDKAYPYIKVTVQEAFPRVMFARRVERDKAKYFGPFPSAGAVKSTIELIRKIYQIRNCNRRLPRDIGRERPCLNYHIHQCKGPCQGYISQEDYRASIEKALKFLSGDYKGVLTELRHSMEEASLKLEFEKALEYKNLMESVQQISERQKMEYTEGEERDLVACGLGEEEAVIQIFFIRGGRLIGRDHFYIRREGVEEEELLSSFLKQFYGGTPYIPKEIILPKEIEERALLEEWLGQKRGHRVLIRVPKKGEKEKLMELATQNAEMILKGNRERLKREEDRSVGAVRELEALLNLSSLNRMEAFDISNIGGFLSVGSMVVYEGGKPKKSDYRKFKIKSVEGPDDYGSLKEVLSRRFARGIKEQTEKDGGKGFTKFPDLILMDGGRGQMRIAEELLKDYGLLIPVCGMVKDEYHRTRGLYYKGREITLPKDSKSFHLITRIQDEAHRFAITFHRKLRGKQQIRSILDEIPKVGEKRRKILMKHFSNMEEIRKASVEDLRQIPGLNASVAQSIFDFFHEEKRLP